VGRCRAHEARSQAAAAASEWWEAQAWHIAPERREEKSRVRSLVVRVSLGR
jgi:hypothetical protein